MSLVFELKSIEEIDDHIKELLIEYYRYYYEKIYGVDAFDAFLKVTGTKSFNFKNYKFADIAKNYARAVNSVSDNAKVLMIYNLKLELIGVSRIKKINSYTIKVLDIVFSKDISNSRDAWSKTVSFIYNYYKCKSFKKMYLEIPLKEGPLLIRANELGFKERPEDIKVSGDIKTYILYKDLYEK